ncbi:hypothetical protein [Lysobacter antibioticus]|uniref:hypothetical protein n=2 Tax=Lysobacter antibioticus TaxID=84531 RepID=UPI000AF9CD98|nr:hypothetical protein [Lysobacter antibioticus]
MERHGLHPRLRRKNSVTPVRASAAPNLAAPHESCQRLPHARPSTGVDFARISAYAPQAAPQGGRADPDDTATIPQVPSFVLQPPSLLSPRPRFPRLSLVPPLRLSPPLPTTTPPPPAPAPSLMPLRWPLRAPLGLVPPLSGLDPNFWQPPSTDMNSRIDWLGIRRAYSARGSYFGSRDADSFVAEAQRSSELMRTIGMPERLRLGPLNLDLLNLGLRLQADQLNARENPNFMDRMQSEWKVHHPNDIRTPIFPFFSRDF